MIVSEQGDETSAVELASYNADMFGIVAKREGYEIALEAVVASHGAVCCHDEQLLILGPAQAPDRSLVPLEAVSIIRRSLSQSMTKVAYVDASDQLARAAVDVDARLGRPGAPVRLQLVFIAIDGYSGQPSPKTTMRRQWQASGTYLPTAPLYGAPTTW